jgi:hypothetical protein
MLTSVLSKIGLPILVEFVARALGRIDHPVARNARDALEEVEGALAGGLITPEQMAEANRHAEAMAEINIRQYETSLSEINQSLRAEIGSNDAYVRRMRPTFGYLMALTWAAQMFAIAYVVIFETQSAAIVLQGMASLSTIWAVGLSVLGIYVYKRSEDKKIFSPPLVLAPVAEDHGSPPPPVPSRKPPVKSPARPATSGSYDYDVND